MSEHGVYTVLANFAYTNNMLWRAQVKPMTFMIECDFLKIEVIR